MPFHIILFLFAIMPAIHVAPLYSQSLDTIGKIEVVNLRPDIPQTVRTRYQAGPCVGDILNFHFFPGLQDFERGNYSYALGQMNYFLERPQYTSENPKQSEFMSLAFYIRGSIYLNYAEGIGRLGKALNDFKAALSWRDDFYPAMIGLARVYMATNHNDDAKNTLKLLLSKDPPDNLATEANNLLIQIASPDKTPIDSEEISPDASEAADDAGDTDTPSLQSGEVDSPGTSMEEDAERTAGDDVTGDTSETAEDAAETDAPAEKETEDVNSTEVSSTER
jgi:tetratricopeptide (TPR) repeat protein